MQAARRIIGWFILFVFLTFAVFQANDSDGLLWIVLYLLPAVYAYFLLIKAKRELKPIGFILGAAYLIAAIAIFPTNVGTWIEQEQKAQSLGMDMPFLEEAREALGLFLCFLATALPTAFTKGPGNVH